MSGEPSHYPTQLDHTAYHVVQEGLTNAMKHARDAPVTVRVAHRATTLTIEVINDRPSQQTVPDPPQRLAGKRNGRGLTGLEHRIDEFGGTLTAETQAQGGYPLITVMPHEADTAPWRRADWP